MWRASLLGLGLAVLGASAGVSAALEPLVSADDFLVFHDGPDGVPAAGLVGSYVDANLIGVASEDWRDDATITIAGTRIDASLDFTDRSWGSCSEVNITCATDTDWNGFSVQWDGWVSIQKDGTRLATRSDDSSRTWIDIDGDGLFDSTGPEFVNNHWGDRQLQTVGGVSVPLAQGVYPIRIQYAEQVGANVMQLISVPEPTLRVAYVIPSNRTPQPNGVANLQQMVLAYGDWYCEQMDRNGFGRLTPRIELEADGVTPRVHTVFLAETDDELRKPLEQGGGAKFFAVVDAAKAAGVPVNEPGESWFLVPETHLMLDDGRIVGRITAGGSSTGVGVSAGSAIAPGMAMVASDRLSLANFAALADESAYDGKVVPEIGPFSLIGGVSFPNFERTTFSSVVSAYVGAILHELSHNFGLHHDFRHDVNFNGNLMFNGLRGVRGALLPQQFPDDYTRLSYTSAMELSTSQYFTSCEGPPPDSAAVGERPQVCVLLSGDDPAGCAAALTTGDSTAEGQVQIHFAASDPEGLSLAILSWCPLNQSGKCAGPDSRVGELELSGTDIQASFSTPYFKPGSDNRYRIRILDVEGNRSTALFDLITGVASNRAPRPGFHVDPPQTVPRGSLSFDASLTTDSESADSELKFEWQFAEEDRFKGWSSKGKVANSYSTEGARLIRLRVTDPDGASVLSTPIAVRIHRPCNDGIDNDGDGVVDYPADRGCKSEDWHFENPQCDDDLDNDGDGMVDWDGGDQQLFGAEPACKSKPSKNREDK